ncbi:hypothetical protein PLEOSDRAFT_1028736, partial [Pleurotus ostreatus PC15]
GVRLHDKRRVRYPMRKHGGRGERSFERVEGVACCLIPIPGQSFARATGQRDHNIRVVPDEAAVEIGKAEEGLYVANLPRFRPVLDRLDFRIIHGKTLRGENVAEIFHSVRVEFAFVGARVEFVLAEPTENLL